MPLWRASCAILRPSLSLASESLASCAIPECTLRPWLSVTCAEVEERMADLVNLVSTLSSDPLDNACPEMAYNEGEFVCLTKPVSCFSFSQHDPLRATAGVNRLKSECHLPSSTTSGARRSLTEMSQGPNEYLNSFL